MGAVGFGVSGDAWAVYLSWVGFLLNVVCVVDFHRAIGGWVSVDRASVVAAGANCADVILVGVLRCGATMVRYIAVEYVTAFVSSSS